jgi:hypothetical protein
MEFKRIGIKQVLVNVTGVILEEVIPAASGFRTSITQLIASNQSTLNSFTLYEGDTQLTPTIGVGTSGTLFIDDFGGVQYELATSSGLNANLGFPSGDFQVQVFYLQHDERPPITNSAARAFSHSNVTVSRAGG